MPQRTFTIYLLNHVVTTIAQAHSVSVNESFNRLPLKGIAGEDLEGEALLIQNSKAPPWLKSDLPFWGMETGSLYFTDPTSFEQKPILNVTHSCLVIFKKYDRVFALTFGPAARWKLKDVVDDFGLKVLLNSVEPTKINRLSTKHMDGLVEFETDHYASALVRLEQFGLIASNEFMTVLAGKPEDCSYAVRITGGRGLRVIANVETFTLDDFIRKTLDYYKSTQYQQKFPFYEKGVEPVTDPGVLSILDVELRAKLSSESALVGLIGLRYEQVEPTSIKLVLADGVESDVISYLDWDFVEAFLVEKCRQRSDLCNASIILRYPGSGDCQRRFLDVVTADVMLPDGIYLYYGGKWSRFDQDYLKKKELELQSLVQFVPNLLPPFDPNVDFKISGKGVVTVEEERYIDRICRADSSYHSFDRNLMQNAGYRGRGNEFCDILKNHPDQRIDLIHIKRGNALGPISYILHQGLGSMHMTFNSPSFRTDILESLKEPLKSKMANAGSSDITVVFAIINSSSYSGLDFLPLSGKLALYDIAKLIKNEYRASVVVTRVEQISKASDWEEVSRSIAKSLRIADEIDEVGGNLSELGD